MAPNFWSVVNISPPFESYIFGPHYDSSNTAMGGKEHLKDFKELTYSDHFSDSALTFLSAIFFRQRIVVFKPDNTRLRVSIPADALAHLNKHTTQKFDMLDVVISFLTNFSLSHCKAAQMKYTFQDS